MSSLTVTVTTPSGRSFVHTRKGGGGSIYDSRVVPQSFWDDVANSLDLAGEPGCTGFGTDHLPVAFGSEPNTFVSVGEVRIYRPVKTGPNRWDYTQAGSRADCRIEIVSDYRD